MLAPQLCNFSSWGGETSLKGCRAGGEGMWETFPASTTWCCLHQLALPLCVPCWAFHTLHMQFPVLPALPKPHGHSVPISRASHTVPHALPWEQLIRYTGTSFKMIFNTTGKALQTY